MEVTYCKLGTSQVYVSDSKEDFQVKNYTAKY